MFLVLVRRCVLDVCHTPYYQAVLFFGRILEENELTELIIERKLFLSYHLNLLAVHVNTSYKPIFTRTMVLHHFH